MVPYGQQVVTGGPESILATMYRQILKDLNIPKHRFEVLARNFVNSPKFNADNREINLYKDLMNINVKWKSFIRGLQALNAKEVNFIFKLVDRDNNRSTHKELIQFLPECKIVSNPNKDISNTGVILASIFHRVLLERNITSERFDMYLVDYFANQVNDSDIVVRNVATVRGNVRKECFRDNMTWQVFIKALAFIQIVKFDMEIELIHQYMKPTIHRREIILDESYLDQ
jgi:hypothetical protein